MASTNAAPPATPATPAPTPSLAQTLKEKLTRTRSTAPYFLAALLAATAMGWYFFIFVPQKLEYFVGLRFRTLAVATGQIKSKAENLGRSLNSAPAARADDKAVKPKDKAVKAKVAAPATPAAVPPEKATAKYLRLLVPDIQLVEGASPRPQGLQLAVTRAKDDPSASLSATVAWQSVASQAALASTSEFDDLVVAEKSGVVVWQRETTTPRLGNLTELIYAEDDKGTLLSPSRGIHTAFPAVDSKKGLPKTATLKAVRVGATSTWMLVQAVNLDSPYITNAEQKTLYVAGFVSRNRLQQQAMRIPLAWLVVVWLPIAVLFLALPFIKLATMNAKERFSVANLILMATGTLAAAGLAAVIPIGPRSVSTAGDGTLERIGRLVDKRLGEESENVLALANAVARLQEGTSELEKCQVPPEVKRWRTKQPCELWEHLSLNALFNDPNKRVPELDVAIWVDDQGGQVRKWTTKTQLTGEASHRGFEHFQNLTVGTLWRLGEKGRIPFIIEPLRAPTTAELGVVFAMPLNSLRDSSSVLKASETVREDDGARFLALNIRPHAIVDAVLPPGYEFAIVAPGGKVLFHSNEGLSLEENFFEEVSDARGVRERMQTGRAVTWSGDYHGTPHRMHIQPVSTLYGSPWKIVTFQDLRPGLASVVDHQSGTFRLGLINITLLLVAVLVTWWYTKYRGRDYRDLMTAPLSADPKRLIGLPILIVVAVAGIVATAHPLAHQWANVLYAGFALLPFFAASVSVYARCPGARPDNDRNSPLVRLEIAMLVVLLGAAPAAGFARIVQRVQDAQATERWLDVAHQRLAAHDERVRARENSPSYSETTRERLRKVKAFELGAERDAFHSYLPESPVWPRDEKNVECDAAPEYGQAFVRRLLDWTPFSSERPGAANIRACAGSNRLRLDEGVSLTAEVWPAVHDVGLDRGNWEWERWMLAFLVLSGTIVAAYWARRRLTPPPAVGGSTFEDVLALIGSRGNEGIMLVGPPRTRKDQVVKRAVLKQAKFPKQPDGKEPIYRIKLLEQTIDAGFIATALEEVAARLKQSARLDKKKRLWIHVSNLETQLISAERRAAVLELLEKLLERPDGEPCRVVVVTTSIDPIAHFHEIFTKEREGIYDDDIPEVQLSRSSLVLSRFRRCYLPIEANKDVDPWWKYDDTKWEKTLDWEAAEYPPLVEVAKAIKKSFSSATGPNEKVSRPDLARAFRSQAQAAYDLLWASCTRCEKIVLIQLAQEGFVTTQNCEVVWGLINKGLIVERPKPTIFNNSFRRFLRHIEHDNVVDQWERQDGSGLWLVAGRLIGSSLIAGGLFYLTTQDFSVDSLLPVVSGTGIFSAPIVRAVLARVTARGAALIAG